jgi:hypothetical protein
LSEISLKLSGPGPERDKKLERTLHCNNHRLQWRSLEGAEMKIYLLILLIGALLTTIHFTQSPDKTRKPVSQ